MLLCTVGGPLPQGGEEGPLARSRGCLWALQVQQGFPPLPSGDEMPCLLSTLSDLLGGESQRGDEPRGDPAPSRPGGQEDETHHHCLAAGLRLTHGESFPAPRNTACSGLTPAWAWTQPMGIQAS